MRRVWAIKGFPGAGRPIVEKPSYAKPFVKVGADSAKKRVYDRLLISKPGPGYCHFPTRYDQDYFDGLTSEKLITVYRKGYPVRQWIKKREDQRNEQLDVRGYNIAALIALNPDLKVAYQQLAARAEERKKATDTTTESPPPMPSGRGRRGGNWATTW
jgi:phage terminase large subunit GpA-like protein